MWKDVGRYGERLIKKVRYQFCQSIFSEDNLAFLANYFEATAKAMPCVLPTVDDGRRGKMLEKVERCGDRLPSKPYEQVWKSIIINRKLPFSGHYFEVTTKSISTRYTSCALLGHIGKCGKMWEIWGTFAQKVSNQFCQSIFSEDNLSFLAYYCEATTKSNCMRFTNCGWWEMGENVGEGGKV